MRALNIRIGQQLIGSIAGNLTKPFFGIVLAMAVGEERAGVALSTIAFLSIFFGLLGGKVSDTFGRKNVLLFGEIVRFLASLMLVISFNDRPWNIVLALLSFGFHTFASSYTRPGSEALLLDLCPKDKRRKVFQFNHWGWNLSVMIGYIVGGILFEKYASLLFICVAFISAIDIVLIHFFITEKNRVSSFFPQISDFKSIVKKVPWKLLQEDRMFLCYLIASGLVMSVQLGVYAILPIKLVKLSEQGVLNTIIFGGKAPLEIFGILMAINTVIIIVTLPLVGRYLKKMPIRLLLIAGIILISIGPFIILSFSSVEMMILAMTFIAIGEILFGPAKKELFAIISAENRRGEYAALDSIVFRVASSISPLFLSLYGILESNVLVSIFFVIFTISIYYFSSSLMLENCENEVAAL